jgi:hypothetical protein
MISRKTQRKKGGSQPAFWNNAKRYYDLKSYRQNCFGYRVHKLPIDAGSSARTRRSGRHRGCITATGDRRPAGGEPSVGEQIRGKNITAGMERWRNCLFPDFNTYALWIDSRRFTMRRSQWRTSSVFPSERARIAPDETIALIRSYAKVSCLAGARPSIDPRPDARRSTGHDRATFLNAVKRTETVRSCCTHHCGSAG